MEEPPHRLSSRRWPVGIFTPLLGAHHKEGNGRIEHAGLLPLEELIEPAQLHVVDDARSAALIGDAGRSPGHMGPWPDDELLPDARRVRPAISPHANEILHRAGEEDVVPARYVQRGNGETAVVLVDTPAPPVVF